MPTVSNCPVVVAQPVTGGPHHHFFGYYDKSPWDHTRSRMLAMRSKFMDRPPTANDILSIGVIDLKSANAWHEVATTRAWNWQQGCMLQWLDGGRGGDIIFNDLSEGRFVSRILNVNTGRTRTLPLPVYTVNRTGSTAVSLNFSRLHHQRPGYGYAGVPDPWLNEAVPKDDGLHAIDIRSGETTLILSVNDVAEFKALPSFQGKVHRFNHAQFGPNNGRFAFLHRYKPAGDKDVGETRLMTVDTDGSHLCCLSDHGLVSHYDWRHSDSLLAWARRREIGDHYFEFEDPSGSATPVGMNVLPTDGHCSFSPDREWVLTDTYPDETNHRTLILFHFSSGERIDIGRFFSPPVRWQIRCDLHPRWSPDGRSVCIDSVHEGMRQMYVLDVGDIVDGK